MLMKMRRAVGRQFFLSMIVPVAISTSTDKNFSEKNKKDPLKTYTEGYNCTRQYAELLCINKNQWKTGGGFNLQHYPSNGFLKPTAFGYL